MGEIIQFPGKKASETRRYTLVIDFDADSRLYWYSCDAMELPKDRKLLRDLLRSIVFDSATKDGVIETELQAEWSVSQSLDRVTHKGPLIFTFSSKASAVLFKLRFE